MARTLDVLREIDAIRRERQANAAQDGARVRLIVDGIERGDEVECCVLRFLVEAAQIPRREDDIGMTPASWRAKAIASSERSSPTKRLLGNQPAIRFSARPRPQPTSSTRIPASRRSIRPGTSGRM